MRPRILVVVRWPVGGIRTWCRYVYRDPTFAKYEIELILPDDSEGRCLERDLGDTGLGVNVLHGVSGTGKFISQVAHRILFGRFDFVHSHGFTSALSSFLPCKFTGVPHLVTPHDVVLDWQYRSVKHRIARAMIGIMLRNAACVQAVGQAAGDNLRESFSLSDDGNPQILTVRNGIETSRFLDAEPEDVRSSLGIPDNAIIVGFFGRFMAQKGFRYLVEAIEIQERTRLSDLPIVVVAVGGGGFRREEELAIQRKLLSHRFRFVEFSPNIAGMLKGVDMVVMPSLWEACPILPMEVMTAGVPLIISDFSACLEVVEGSPARIVPAKNGQRILEAIVATTNPTAKEMAKSFSKAAAKKFDVARTIEGVARIYSDMSRGI